MSQIKKSTGQQPDITPKLEPEEGRIQIDSSCEVSRTQPATLPASNIKQEPSVAPGSLSFATSDKARDVKEPTSPVQGPSGNGAREDPSHRSFFQVYERAADIPYTPENALKEGTGMVKALQANINRIDLGSKMRQDVWRDEIADLLGQGTPTTMIAVCGATGAGKSSILNAILDDNIVPTSGMRACTAVVTEIGFHKKKTIDGDVSFLTEKEWRDELKVLLDDLVDEDGNLKRSTDLRSDAGVAWSKVHAVYPTISQEQLIKMTVDEIIARDGNIAKLLGTTKHMSAPDSKTFGKDISKYIDSKDQKRGEKKDKKKKEKDKEKAKERDDGPAYWPLIRQVRVWCNTNALSTGAILVDLPGVADANAARNNIAKDYMKKCNCVWVLAPITRAVDDKTARDLMGDAFKTQLMMDGNYDANAITFIATKCDDISCFEVIRALNLEDDPELELIEEEIGQAKVEIEEWGSKKADAEKAARDVNSQLQDLRDIHQECEEHLLALQRGLPFQPTLSSKTQTFSFNTTASQSDTTSNRPKKRKRSGCESPPKKRMRGGDVDAMAIDDDDDFIVDDDLNFSDEDKDGDRNGSVKDSESDEDSDSDEVDAETEIATPESLKERIAQVKQAIKDGRVQLSAFKAQRKDAVDMLATLKKRQNEAQRRKNAFCSLKRSEFSRDVLKEDFRTGLKDLDDAEQEQKNPEKFDPTVNIRDYEAIDLPVFTCSARDYVRIKGQVKGDGDPTCFTKVEDTAIPELRQWCHQLTVSSRSRAAQSFLTHLTSFAKNVHVYLEGIGDVTDADRAAMREQWESNMADEQSDDDDMHASDDFRGLLEDLALEQFKELDAIHYKAKEEQKLDPDGEPVGITPRLTKEFEMVVDDCVAELQERFKDGLEEKCHVGALNAAAAAVGTSDGFASEMHWATYRATLRRLGTWRRDLNVELTNPFTRQIASSWSKVFEADLFASFQRATLQVIENLIADVVASAALGLKQRAKSQGELCLEEARGVLDKILDVVNETVITQQKEVSRCLAPHVQAQLTDGYHRAMEERGRGSVQRQKVLFHDYVDNIRTYVFDGAADIVMTRLSQAAEAVGDALQSSLDELSRKIEVSIAVLWEGVRDDPEQVRVREEVVNCVSEILRQLEMWKEVDKAATLKRLG